MTLDGSDFADACEDATDEDFSYIKFTSVTATGGKLYVDYDEDDSSHTKATAAKAYDEDDLDDITFVPTSGYSGTATFAYTGYTEDDTEYTGTVKITVNNDDITADVISYTIDDDDTVTLDGSDFADACEDATDEDFSYIKFTSVTATGGKLYVDYDEDDSSHTKATAAKAYDEDDLDDITFVPTSGYSGSVTFTYTGYSEDGTKYTGTLKIKVT